MWSFITEAETRKFTIGFLVPADDNVQFEPLPIRADYDSEESYLRAWYVARAIRRDGILNAEESAVKLDTLCELIMPDRTKRAHP